MKINNKITLYLVSASSAVLLGISTGCVGYAEPGYAGVAVAPPAVGVVVQDEYLYYPHYGVYYNTYRNNYVYRDRFRWVTRPNPPRGLADDFRRSPSVHLDFHDSPVNHHRSVVRQYPRHWRPGTPGFR